MTFPAQMRQLAKVKCKMGCVSIVARIRARITVYNFNKFQPSLACKGNYAHQHNECGKLQGYFYSTYQMKKDYEAKPSELT